MTNIKDFQPLLLTNSWMRSTWEFCSEHCITLDDKTIKIPLLWENDIAIMEAFQNNSANRKEEWATLNKCRIFLKAFSLADTSTGDGNFISSSLNKHGQVLLARHSEILPNGQYGEN